MRRFIFAVLLLAACKGTDGVDPAITTSVSVTANPAQIPVNGTAQASAIVKDQNGNNLTGKTVAWSSLNASVATVTPAGVIRGVAPGTATIQGTVDGITGTATVQVIAAALSCSTGPVTINLAVGEARVLSSTESRGCVRIAATAGLSQYLVIAANANAIPDQLETYALRSDTGEVIPANTLLLSPQRIAASLTVPAPDASMALQAAFERRLRKIERMQVDIAAAGRAYRSGSLGSPGRASVNAAAIPVVGEKTPFKVPNLTNPCSAFKTITATARYISTRAILYTDDASPPGGFTDTDFQQIGTEFDNLIYPTDVDYFGTPLDLDRNSRVIILYTPEVNRLTPENNPGGFVGGFFFAGDLLPGNDCPQSNNAELFYLLTPDPNGDINGNRRTTASVREGTRGTIAHEFQHMINASLRIPNPQADAFESVWLDEALSHFAEDAVGRVLKGLSETGNYTADDLTSNSVNVNDYAAFFFQNFARFARYLQNPGPASPTSSLADSSLAARGAAWALLRYTADHYAPGGNVKTFIRSVVAGPDTGVANLRSKAGAVPFDTLIAGWMIANYADDAGINGLATKYTYKTYNMRNNLSNFRIVQSQTYPLLIRDIAGTGFLQQGLQARSASGNYFFFSRTAGTPARTFRFLNPDLSTAASFTGAALYFLRTQ